MEDIFKKIIKIAEELRDPYCTLKDMDLVNRLQELETLMKQVDESGKWDETDFTYNDRWWTEGVIQQGVKCRKRRTIEQFHKQYGTIQFQDFLQFLIKCIESYLKKNYNIS
jgi:hypothetical protein